MERCVLWKLYLVWKEAGCPLDAFILRTTLSGLSSVTEIAFDNHNLKC